MICLRFLILAYCGQFDDAGAEMASLEPYIDGLTGEQRQEIENQSHYIAQLAHKALKCSRLLSAAPF